MTLTAKTMIGFALAAALLTGCSSSDTTTDSEQATSSQPTSGTTDQGNDANSENRQLKQFNSIEVSTGMAVELSVASGTQQSVQVKTPDTYTGKVTTDVADQVLRISQDGMSVGEGPTVTVAIPKLKSLVVDQGSSVNASGNIDSYTVTLAQGSNLSAAALRAEEVTVDIDQGSNAEIFAAKSVTGAIRSGSNLQVRGDADTSQVEVASGSNLSD
jgi:major membrane immunogen (membrane-anchored lipoprotein)